MLIVENVKESAVEDGLELLAKIGQLQCVPDQKSCVETAIASLALRQLDRPRHGVDTGSVESPSGCHECVFAGSASNIQYASGKYTLVSQLDKR